jgi:hypothetical protein
MSINYHIFTITTTYWETIYKKFEKDIFLFSCFKKHIINENDYIFFYHKNTGSKNGFLCYCQAETPLIKNTEKIKIFKDDNLNAYYCKLKNMHIFTPLLKISKVYSFLSLSELTVKKFVYRYLRHSEEFLLVPVKLGKLLLLAIDDLCYDENIKIHILNNTK